MRIYLSLFLLVFAFGCTTLKLKKQRSRTTALIKSKQGELIQYKLDVLPASVEKFSVLVSERSVANDRPLLVRISLFGAPFSQLGGEALDAYLLEEMDLVDYTFETNLINKSELNTLSISSEVLTKVAMEVKRRYPKKRLILGAYGAETVVAWHVLSKNEKLFDAYIGVEQVLDWKSLYIQLLDLNRAKAEQKKEEARIALFSSFNRDTFYIHSTQRNAFKTVMSKMEDDTFNQLFSFEEERFPVVKGSQWRSFKQGLPTLIETWEQWLIEVSYLKQPPKLGVPMMMVQAEASSNVMDEKLAEQMQLKFWKALTYDQNPLVSAQRLANDMSGFLKMIHE